MSSIARLRVAPTDAAHGWGVVMSTDTAFVIGCLAVLGSRNWITPCHELENEFFPQASWFIDLFHERIQPINGYVATKSFTDVELLRRSRLGV